MAHYHAPFYEWAENNYTMNQDMARKPNVPTYYFKAKKAKKKLIT